MQKTNVIASWLLVGAFGAAAFVLALDFNFGTPRNIGAAIYPLGLSGLIVLIAGFRIFAEKAELVSRLQLRPLAAIVASVLAFTLTVDHLGMLPAAVLSTFAAYAGQSERNFGFLFFYALVLGAGAWLIFSFGLNVPLALVPGY